MKVVLPPNGYAKEIAKALGTTRQMVYYALKGNMQTPKCVEIREYFKEKYCTKENIIEL